MMAINTLSKRITFRGKYKLSSIYALEFANDVYRNTDHNDLIDSPDSLADEMGKLEGEIAFPPVPVNYYFVLLAILILIGFGNIFSLFFLE